MGIQERKNLEEKLESASKYIESIDKNKGKLCELENAIKYLSDKIKPASKPHKRDENVIYREQVTDKIAAYDKLHQPQKPTLRLPSIKAIIAMLTAVIFFVVLFTIDNCKIWFILVQDWQETTPEARAFFIALCVAIVLIPLIILTSKIYLIVTYDKKVEKYFSNNPERAKQLEDLEANAKREIAASLKRYLQMKSQYEQKVKENAEVDEKLAHYEAQRKALEKSVELESTQLAALFDEIEMPEEYRDDKHLQMTRLFLLADTMKIDADTLTASESLQNAYNVFRRSDEEYEIKMLASLQVQKELARERAARERETIERMAENQRRQDEINKRIDEEENKRLEHHQYIIDNQ